MGAVPPWVLPPTMGAPPSVVCAGLRGKISVFSEMEANFKVSTHGCWGDTGCCWGLWVLPGAVGTVSAAG